MEVEGDSARFCLALEQENLDDLMRVAKVERLAHMGLYGNPQFLFHRTGVWVDKLPHPLNNVEAMHRWAERHVQRRFDHIDDVNLWMDACFQQARRDGLTHLVAGEDIWSIFAMHGGDLDDLFARYERSRACFAPDCELIYQIGLSRHCDLLDMETWAEPLFASGRSRAMDLYGDERAQPIKDFVSLYRHARQLGLRLRAHVGQTGSARDVLEAVELLDLDEVQHGTAIAQSPEVMRALAARGTLVNVCPTADLMRGAVKSLSEHPLRAMIDHGVRVTLGADQPLTLGTSLSLEYQRLYQGGVCSATELNSLRINGLNA